MHIILMADTNTSIIGIANSVDLLNNAFYGNKKELTLIESKLVFEPYNKDDVMEIIQKKHAKLFANHKETFMHVKDDYQRLFEDQSIELIGRKVEQDSGDIRVAFDITKSALQGILKQMQNE